jgi:hypothetical protein
MASIGLRFPFIENCEANCMKRIYEKLRANPIPMFIPIPPLIFLDERLTPMRERIKTENGVANRL